MKSSNRLESPTLAKQKDHLIFPGSFEYKTEIRSKFKNYKNQITIRNRGQLIDHLGRVFRGKWRGSFLDLGEY